MQRLLHGSAALVVLLGVLPAIPLALMRHVGRPWPRSMPPLETIWATIKSGDVSDNAIIKGLAILVWIAWARLTLSILIEVAARWRRRDAPHVIGLGSFQHWAAALVTSVVILVGAGPRPSLAAAPQPRVAIASVAPVSSVPAAPSASVSLPSSPPRARAQRTSWRVHVVQRNESFWSIAEDQLGDGLRWREIVELNAGHEVAVGVIFDGTPNRLLPGWQLLVPDGHVDRTTANASTSEKPDPRTVVVEQGDTLSSIAADAYGDPSAWPPLWEANRGHTFGQRTFSDPNLIVPGWELIVPDVVTPSTAPPISTAGAPEAAPQADPAPAVALPSIAPVDDRAPVGPLSPVDKVDPIAVDPHQRARSSARAEPAYGGTGATPADATGVPAELPVVELPAAPLPSPDVVWLPPAGPAREPAGLSAGEGAFPTPSSAAAPAGLGAALLVSGGVLAAVVGRRRGQLRRATVNSRFADPSDLAVRTETTLRRLGDGEIVARLDVALRAAAGELVAAAPGVHVLGAIVEATGRVDLLLSGVAVPPPPWSAVTGHRWSLDESVDVADLAGAARRAGQPCPALAHLGSTPLDQQRGRGELFIDLEAIGLLTIDAQPGYAADVVRAIAAGVAVSPMAEIAHIITSGFDLDSFGHPSLHHASSLDVALDLAATSIGTTAATTSAALSTFTLRAQERGGEAWEPAIVLAVEGRADDHDHRVDADLDTDLANLTRVGGRGLAVIIDRPVEGTLWRAEQQLHGWMLHPLGLEFTPVGLASDDIDDIRVVLDEADRVLIESTPGEIATETSDVAGDVDRAVPLMVRVLGPVEVVDVAGRVATFERSKALELVVWLSQHRDRSTRGGARTALWESTVRDATFANVVSDARRSLARLVPPPDGEEWIGRTLTEQLPLHHEIATDAELLASRLAVAKTQDPATAIATLQPGLALVRDVPFAATAYLWPDPEGITSQLTLLVTSAATVMANHCLVLGDTAGVFWATGQGLKVLAGHEELIGLRIRAHGRSGDLAGVRSVWDSYERVLQADAWSDSEPSPKLVALRRQLLTRSLSGV